MRNRLWLRMPICTKCSVEKSDSEFYRGVPRCKECHKAAVHANWLKKMEDPEWREMELTRHREKAKRMRSEGKFASPEATKRGKKAWEARNKHKRYAQGKVAFAVRKGTLIRKPCEKCGSLDSEAHHDDYSNPLDVRWLCDTHHKDHHVEMRRLERFTRDQLNLCANPARV